MSASLRLEAGADTPTDQRSVSFIALILLVWHQEEHLAVKKRVMVICLERDANDLHVVQLMPLLPHHLLLH